MHRNLWPSLALLLGCESWYIDNPRNCVLNSNACGEKEQCNIVSKKCETTDCNINTTLCAAGDICNTATGSCEAITFVLGQPSAMANENAAYGMYSPQAVTLIPDSLGYTKVVVGDTNNHRVLIWNDVPTQSRPADAVLGMPNIRTLSGSGAYGGITSWSTEAPWSVTGLGTRLIIGDQVYNRLLIWNPIPSQIVSDYPTGASGLWGQINLNVGVPHNGSQVNATGVSAPLVFVEPDGVGSGRFFVSDSGNNRVLLFDAGVPASPSTQPSRLIGQAGFAGSAAGTSRTTLRSPRGVASDGNVVFVVDAGNHRVMGYPIARVPQPGSSASAFFIIGQSSFNAGAENRGLAAPDLTTLSSPQAVAACNDLLFIADQGNNRVLAFKASGLTRYDLNSAPNKAETAQLVLGQGLPTDSQPNRNGAPALNTLNGPSDVHCVGTRLIVADTGNHRTLIWDNADKLQSGQAADRFLGQPSSTTGAANMPPLSDPLRFSGPMDVASDGNMLAVADTGNHRVLVWKNFPSSGSVPPDVILGQPGSTQNRVNNNLPAPTAQTLSSPSGVAIEGNYLAVSDTGNNRVLVWSLPTSTYAPAKFVVGQSGFTTSTRGTVPTDATLAQPAGVALSSSVLYVADSGLNRVMVYKNPFAISPSASLMLGQPNAPSLSAKTLAVPTSVAVSQGKLLVADGSNQRVLIWNSLPTSNYQGADVVVGQPDFTHAYTSTSSLQLNAPSGVLVYKGRLFVAAALQNRVLFWNQVPTTNEREADGVLGQATFFTDLPNIPVLDALALEQLSSPGGMTAVGSRLIIADTLNNRVVVRSLPAGP